MKRQYEKPMVYFEDMSFDTAIASTCNWVYTTDCQTVLLGPGQYECLEFGPDLGTKFFTSNLSECEGGVWVCYHVAAAEHKLATQS